MSSKLLRPGQDLKWPREIAWRRVGTMGLNRTPCMNAARSDFVAAQRMALAAVSVGGLDKVGVFVLRPRLSEGLPSAPIAGHSGTDVRLGARDEHLGGSGIDQRRVLGLRRPFMMTVPSLIIWTWYLEKSAMHSSSQSFPMDRREPVERPSNTCPVLAAVDSCGARGSLAVWVALMKFPSAAVTSGPLVEV